MGRKREDDECLYCHKPLPWDAERVNVPTKEGKPRVCHVRCAQFLRQSDVQRMSWSDKRRVFAVMADDAGLFRRRRG